MLVRMLTDRAGVNFAQQCGEVYDLPQREAMALIAAEQAEVVGPETATESETETAALRINRPPERKERRNDRAIH